MLVLSRHKDQEVWINKAQIKIVVIEIRGDKVRLGIQAPQEVDVHRREVYEKIYGEQEGGERR